MEHTLHGGTVGSMREDVWKGLFEMILPKKFVIEQSVFIIDSQEGISHEVDLAIVDETYTPYIFHYGRLKFIPIEAVAAVVECKSQSLSEDGLKTWCESIVSLKTADESIARTASGVATAAVPTQKSTRPIRYYAHSPQPLALRYRKCLILFLRQMITPRALMFGKMKHTATFFRGMKP